MSRAAQFGSIVLAINIAAFVTAYLAVAVHLQTLPVCSARRQPSLDVVSATLSYYSDFQLPSCLACNYRQCSSVRLLFAPNLNQLGVYSCIRSSLRRVFLCILPNSDTTEKSLPRGVIYAPRAPPALSPLVAPNSTVCVLQHGISQQCVTLDMPAAFVQQGMVHWYAVTARLLIAHVSCRAVYDVSAEHTASKAVRVLW